MKKVRLTYHMRTREEVAETCIDIPMTDENASALLVDPQRFLSCMASEAGYRLFSLLHDLAVLQGYRFDSLCTAEEVPWLPEEGAAR